jgi:hypothetical protein
MSLPSPPAATHAPAQAKRTLADTRNPPYPLDCVRKPG